MVAGNHCCTSSFLLCKKNTGISVKVPKIVQTQFRTYYTMFLYAKIGRVRGFFVVVE